MGLGSEILEIHLGDWVRKYFTASGLDKVPVGPMVGYRNLLY